MRAVVLTLALLFALPLQADTAQPSGTITVEDSEVQDAAIATRIRSILGGLQGYEDVTVVVDSGIVTFRGTTLDMAAAGRLNDLAARVDGVVAVENNVTETADVAARLDPAIARFKARLAQLMAIVPLAGIALAVFAAVTLFGMALARRKQPWDRMAPNLFIADIYRQILRLIFILAGVVIALDIMNATALLSTILGAAGIIGLAIGFAVRDTVENFIASVMLSVRQPFRPNDSVMIDGEEGKVIRLTSRATILMSWDGNQIRIPNATVFKAKIINYTANDERRFGFEIGVASDADLAQVVALTQDTLEALPFVLASPAPTVHIQRIGDGAMILSIHGWVDQRHTGLLAAKSEALRIVKETIEQAGIEVPDTTYRIQMLGGTTSLGISAPTAPPAPKMAKTPDTHAAAARVAREHSDDELAALAETERAAEGAEDLLSENAAKE